MGPFSELKKMIFFYLDPTLGNLGPRGLKGPVGALDLGPRATMTPVGALDFGPEAFWAPARALDLDPRGLKGLS